VQFASDAVCFTEIHAFLCSGGNVIFDEGVYPISAITSIMGPARKVTGVATISIPERIIDVEEYEDPGVSCREGFCQSGKTKRINCDMEDNTFTLIGFGEGTIACVGANFCTFECTWMGGLLQRGTSFVGVDRSTWPVPNVLSSMIHDEI